MRRAALGLAFAALAALSTAAAAQVLYKWIDKDGKVQYSDRAPKGFTGPVTRIDIDAQAEPRVPIVPVRPAAPSPAPRAIADEAEAPKAADDIGKRRRELRVKLAEAVTQARERLDAAKALLDGGGDPQDAERQVIQQRFDRMQPGRSNCREVVLANGKKAAMCPALIPNDAYYERQKQLEDAVARAEADLAAAEEAYRRGVD